MQYRNIFHTWKHLLANCMHSLKIWIQVNSGALSLDFLLACLYLAMEFVFSVQNNFFMLICVLFLDTIELSKKNHSLLAIEQQLRFSERF